MAEFFLLFSSFSSSFLGENFFNSNISEEELQLLNGTNLVIRLLEDKSEISLKESDCPELEKARKLMEDLDPNYLVEAMYSIPYEKNESVLSQIYELMHNIPLFKKVKFSVDDDAPKNKQIFTVAEEIERSGDPSFLKIKAYFKMPPLSKYIANLEIQKSNDALAFTHLNQIPLNFLGIKVAGASKFLACLVTVRDGDRWLIYACGGLNGWKPKGFKSLIEQMIFCRIRDFAQFYISKVHYVDDSEDE